MARQEALNRITGFGCGDCSGLSPIFGGEFSCPLFEGTNREKLSREQAEEALTCGVPGLYAAVRAGKLPPDEATHERIVEACPFLEWGRG